MQTSRNDLAIDINAVQQKAYELWVQGGCLQGVAEQNWAEAERIVRAESEEVTSVQVRPVSEPPKSAPKASSPVSASQKQNRKIKRH